MKKLYLLLIGVTASLAACNSGSSSSSSTTTTAVACTVNSDETTLQAYESSNPSVNPDTGANYLSGQGTLYNGLAFAVGSFSEVSGGAIAYDVSTSSLPGLVNTTTLNVTYQNGQTLPGNACYSGTYTQMDSFGNTTSTTASLSNCSPATSTIPQVGQTYTFNANYNINANGSIAAESGTLSFSCTMIGMMSSANSSSNQSSSANLLPGISKLFLNNKNH